MIETTTHLDLRYYVTIVAHMDHGPEEPIFRRRVPFRRIHFLLGPL